MVEKKTKKNLKVHFSSFKTDWRTPKELLKGLVKEFGEMFDPCPTNPDFDGLNISWKKKNFVNPPYGNEIKEWCAKAYIENKMRNNLVVMLVPSRTDTKWWHDYIMKADEIRFIQGRLKFNDGKGSAPFPSAIIIFKGKNG